MTWEQLKATYPAGTILDAPILSKIEEKELVIVKITDSFNGKLWIGDLSENRRVSYNLFESAEPGDIIRVCVTGFEEKVISETRINRSVRLSVRVLEQLESINKIDKSEAELLTDLKQLWNIAFNEELVFVGRYFHDPARSTHAGFFNQATLKDQFVFYPDGNPVESFFCPHNNNLISGSYYEFHVKLAPLQFRSEKELPYELRVDNKLPIAFLPDYTDHKGFIKDLFIRRGFTPEDAQVIAAQLKGNELALYTSTERFIFELIQNADDMPFDNSGVSVQFILEQDYLIFLHNGQPFRRGDVQAISSNGMSNKRNDTQKTGYKGIGFKSVFTDSEKVYILSGGFSFMYDKQFPDYRNFNKLYKGYFDKLRPEEATREANRFRGKEDEFIHIENIPWQIKPVWVDPLRIGDSLPQHQQLRAYPQIENSRVGIALYIGRVKIESRNYRLVLQNLFNDPRFLLFLREVKSIRLKLDSHSVKISRKETGNILTVEKTDSKATVKAQYLKSGDNFRIPINDIGFRKSGTGITKKIVKEASENNPAEYNFLDNFQQKIEDIPAKLAKLDETILTFAVPYSRDEIKKIRPEEAIIFSYLPTEDISFALPFLVNGDFVLTQNRENVIPANLWNQHLFYFIAYFHFKWLSQLAKEENLRTTYLNALVRNRFSASELSGERKNICDAFDRGLTDGLNEFPFIVSRLGQIVKASECIIDRTGFAGLLSTDVFKQIAGTVKSVVAADTDWRKLFSADLDIDVFSAKDLVTSLNEPENLVLFNNYLQSLSDTEYLKVLGIFDKTYFNPTDPEKQYLFAYPDSGAVLENIRLFRHSDSINYSMNEIQVHDSLLVHKKLTFHAGFILNELGFVASVFNIANYPAIHSAYSEFLPTDATLFKKIKELSANNTLDPAQRKTLFELCEEFKDIGREALRGWELFPCASDVIGGTVQLGMLTRQMDDTPLWLHGNCISENFYFPKLDKYLIKQTDLYEDLILPNIESFSSEIVDAASYYREVSNYFDHETNTPFTIQKVFFTGTHFKQRGEIYFNKSLASFKNAGLFADTIKQLTGLDMPALEVIPFLTDKESPFYLSDSAHLSSCFTFEDANPVTLSRDAIVTLIDYSILTRDRLFENWTIVKTGDTSFQILKGGSVQYFSKQQLLNEMLSETKFRLLSEQLFTDGLTEIGLMVEGAPFLSKINSALGFKKELAPLYWNENRAIKKQYLENLNSLHIDNSVIYDKKSLEYFILRLVADVLLDEDFDINLLKDKIFIDQQQLSKLVYSDHIRVKREDGSFTSFSLAELLPVYVGSSRTISDFSDQLTILGLKTLESSLFSSKEMKSDAAYDEISNLTELKHPAQIVFVAIYEPEEIGLFSFQSVAKSVILDFLADNTVSGSNEIVAALLDTNLSGKVYPPEFALKDGDENLPDWMLIWLAGPDIAKKLEYLTACGLNAEKSGIVKLRSFFTEGETEPDDLTFAALKATEKLLANTISWLAQEKLRVRKGGENYKWLKKIYDSVTPEIDLPVPVVDSISDIAEIFGLHVPSDCFICSDDGLRSLVFPVLKNLNYQLLAGDFFNTPWLDLLEPDESEVEDVLDLDLLKDAIEWDTEFYKKFTEGSAWRIHLYDGPIPYNTIFLGRKIKSFTRDLPDVDGNNIYLNKNSGDILEIIEKHSILTIAELKEIYRYKSGDFAISPDDRALLEKIKTLSPDTNELLRLAELGKRVENYSKKGHQEPRGNNFGSDINPGLIGEQKVYEKLKAIYGDERVKWISEKNPLNNLTYGTSHDFEIMTQSLREVMLYVDAKSTVTGKYDADKIPIEIRNDEWRFFEQTTKDNYIIARVFNVNSPNAEIKFLKMGLYKHG